MTPPASGDAALRRPGPGDPPPVSARSGATVALAAVAVLVAAADTYVVVLALPEMMAGVGLGLGELQRGATILSGFLLGYVVVLAVAGRVSDVVGRTPVVLACLVVFALGCLVTASAVDLPTAVAGRMLQGLGAGGLVPPTLALVADVWPPARRSLPLGAVGAAQEAGAVAGPLVGAAVLAEAGWRWIFWVNLVLAVLLVAGIGLLCRPGGVPRRRTVAASALAVAAALLLAVALRPPPALERSVAIGGLILPLVDAWRWSTPLVVGVAVLGVAAAAAAATPASRRAALLLLRRVDLLGAVLLGAVLAAVVLVFAGAEVTRSPVDDRWPWIAAAGAAAAVGFAVRQARAGEPLVPRAAVAPRGAWAALLVNVLVGAALVAAVVNVPIFARATRYPDSQLAAALVLLQLLAALPVGAVAGGWLARRRPPRSVAAAGLATSGLALAAMAHWDAETLPGLASSLTLVVAGLGFGLAIAPVTSVLLAVTPPSVHGLASALIVLARTVGMLVGLAVLTAVGLRIFYQRQAAVGSPLELCPDSPTECPAYTTATLSSLVAEQQAIFAGAALCAATAALLAAALLSTRTVSPPTA